MNSVQRIFITVLFLLLIGVLSACASTERQTEDPNKYIFPELQEVKSIRDHDIDSWTQVDKKSLIVNTSPNKSYLIILRQTNNDLRFAHAISFGKEGRIYSKFDSIHIIDSAPSANKLPALIDRIYKLENKEQKETIKATIQAQSTTQ